jgi:DNA helicase-2/ATP-dependent DNA helicase PcrA
VPGFESIKIDYGREYKDAVKLMDFALPGEGLAEINRRRTFARPMPPSRAISTIHKAKGLECDNAIIVPCDRQNFSSTKYSRCKLYVALSRAKKSLTLVVARDDPSPLLITK